MSSRTIDDLWEKLLSDEEVDPGLLVRMDRDIRDLKGNPMIHLGRNLKWVGGALAVLIGMLEAAANFSHIGGLFHKP